MTTSDSNPCNRARNLVLNPPMTLLTTMSVATPSMTLMMHTSARYRVRKYRQQRRTLYMLALLLFCWRHERWAPGGGGGGGAPPANARGQAPSSYHPVTGSSVPNARGAGAETESHP